MDCSEVVDFLVAQAKEAGTKEGVVAGKVITVRIGDRVVNPAHRPFIIAEIGINHGGSLDRAKQMVAAAHRSGAECVKHQTHFVEDEMTEEARSIHPPNESASIWEIMDRSSLTAEEEAELKGFTESLGLIYISTPFSRHAADFLAELDIPAFKIGSGEADNIPLIRHIARFGKPVIMSTGMQSIESLRPSVGILDNAGVDYALLECTNLYPSPPSDVSLKGIDELKSAFPSATVGFSDHSIGPAMALAAVARGAQIIERHFTDSRYEEGPDIICSMDPAELRWLIDRSAEVHQALRSPKRRSTAEDNVYRFARGSIVADRDLAAGTIVSEQDIWARRPGTGEIPASDFDEIIGRRLLRGVSRNTQLTWSDLE